MVLCCCLLLAGSLVGCTTRPDNPYPSADAALPSSDIASLDAVFADTILLARGDFEAFSHDSDPRVAWPLVDLLRFHQGSSREAEVQAAIARVADLPDGLNWVEASNALLLADLPAFPGYLDYKAAQYLTREPEWQPFFDEAVDLDYRLVSWGGVPRDGISPLDDPATVAADRGWIPEDEEVFGMVLGGEARAYPRRVLEVHELVNDTLGGRRLGIPYCTLCGAAQAYFTDDVPDGVEPPVLRTSGLLSRSNKVMYDLVTGSVFDTFTGEALSGPLQDAGVVLDQATVVTTTWAEWKAEHPRTTIIAQDGGIGRAYPSDPLGGRDDDGPIFPIGDVDGRLEVQDQVFGVVLDDGTPIAFPVRQARAALAAGDEVALDGVRLVLDGGGVRAVDASGEEVEGHQAFWFAWSQFMPDTGLWEP